MTAITVNLNSLITLNDNQFYQLCRENPDVKFERNAKGELIIISPTGGVTGNINAEINADFGIWNRKTKLGVFLILPPVLNYQMVQIVLLM
jgi:Uma2 family endonuclease